MGRTEDRNSILETLPEESHTRSGGEFQNNEPSKKLYVIGIAIDAYQPPHKPLNNAKKDFDGFIDVLVERYGCLREHVRKLYDEKATRGGILGLLDHLKANKLPADPDAGLPELPLTKDDSLIIFFAGHGHLDQHTSEGFWIPANESEAYNYIRNGTIADNLHLIKVKHILLISDACFSGAMLSSRPSGGHKLGGIQSSEPSRWIITSGNHQEKVSDGPNGHHSPFTEGLIKALRTNHNKKYPVVKLFQDIQEWMKDAGQTPLAGPSTGIMHKEGFQFTFSSPNAGVDYRELSSALLKLDFRPQTDGFDDLKDSGCLFNTVVIKGTKSCGHELLVNRLRRLIRKSKASIVHNFIVKNSEAHESTADNIWAIIDGKQEPDKPRIVRDIINDLTEKHVFYFLSIHSSALIKGEKIKDLITDFWTEFHQELKALQEKNEETRKELSAKIEKAQRLRNNFYFFILDRTRDENHPLVDAEKQKEVWTNDPTYKSMSLCLPTIQPLRFGKVESWFLTICPEDEHMPPEVRGDLFKKLGSELETIIPQNENRFVRQVVAQICGYFNLPELEAELFRL